jgi:hypothetical protein
MNRKLTSIDESAGHVTAELFAFVRESDLARAGVSRRNLELDGVRRDELAPEQHRAEHHLHALEEVVAHDDHGGAAERGALAGTHGLDLRRRDGLRLLRVHRPDRGALGLLDATCRAASVLRVVVHEHVLGDGEQRTVHADLCADDHLEAAHVARVARVLQAILIAFQEEFQKESIIEPKSTN